MHFTLFVDGYFCNQFDATCYIALEEKQVPYSTARALLRDNQGFPPTMLDRTPIARVPALAHGDFWLTESLAIAEYIDEVVPGTALFPADAKARARARQIMAWLRFDLRTLRAERPWFTTVYTSTPVDPISPLAAREGRELVDIVDRLALGGDLATWNIAHADLALTLMRLSRTQIALSKAARELLDANLARPSMKSYVDHPRPPNPPP